MTESTPGTTPVTDRRTPPRGVIPRHMQTWLMVGLALGILAIIVFTGNTERPQRASVGTSTQPTPPDAARTREYQDRLRLLDERARQQEAETSRGDDRPRTHVTERAPAQQDPIAAEKKRRDYESLFSGVLVSNQSRNDRHVTERRAAPPGTNVAPDAGPGPTSVAALAEMLVRAANNQGARESPARDSAHEFRPAKAEAQSSMRANGSAHRLRQGALISVSLVNRIDSGSPGPVICQVTEPVLSEDTQHVLIPAGARLLGVSKPIQGQDASRVPIAFHTLQVDRHDYVLDQFVALNGIGEAGLRDKVDQHYWSTFGAASMIGLLTGLSQLATTTGLAGGDGDRTIVITGATGDAASQATAQALERYLRQPSRITVTEGHRFHVYVSRDLSLPAYSAESTPLRGVPTP